MKTSETIQNPNNLPERIPFVAFEHYMLADDRPTHPMTCHIRFWFTGKFEREPFYTAIREALQRHPVFQMTVCGSPKNKTSSIHWKKLPDLVMPFISWADSGTPIDEPPGGFAQNIHEQIGLRLWIRDSEISCPTQTMLLVQFHHSVCDGIGLFQFLEDLLIAYGRIQGLDVPPMREIDPSAFALRGEFSMDEQTWQKRRRKDIARTRTFFQSIAQPLAPPPNQGALTKTANLHASERVVMSQDAMEQLRISAHEKNASVNDVLIANLFHVLADWNTEQGRKHLWTRIAIPTSLRSQNEERMSAANVVSMVFLSRKLKEIRSPSLLKSITDEMREIKTDRLGVALPRVVRRMGRYPGMLYRFLRLPVCSATAVLTNLGRPFADSRLAGPNGKLRVGEITLESLETMPPVRLKTSCSISVNYYGDVLSVTLRYDSTVLTQDTAKEILGRYCRRLRERKSQTKGYIEQELGLRGGQYQPQTNSRG